MMSEDRRGSPPRAATRLMERVLTSEAAHHGVLGDLEEEYRARRVAGAGRLLTDGWYWSEAARVWWRFRGEAGGDHARVAATTWSELRVTARGLRRRPGFTAVVLLTLALGTGGSATMFTLVHGILLDALPYPEPERLVAVWPEYWASHSFHTIVNRHRAEGRLDLFEEIGGLAPRVHVLQGEGGATELSGPRVTAGFLDVLRPRMAAGRTFRPGEDEQGNDDVVVITHGFWQSRFGGAPTAVGANLDLRGARRTVIGVLPPGFDVLQAGAEIVVPQSIDVADPSGSGEMKLIGRLRPGISLGRANEEFVAYTASLREEYDLPDEWNEGAELVPLKTWLVGELRPTLLLLFGSTGLLLLIAAGNVAGLVLARALSRRQELAVRRALGASRGRVTRLLWTETVLLGLAGAALGVGVTVAGIPMLGSLLVHLAPESLYNVGSAGLPRLGEVAIDGPVLLFSLALGLLVGIGAGLPAGRPFRRGDVAGALGVRAAGGGTGAIGAGARRALVSAQLAMTVVLLASTGLLAKSLWQLSRVDPGLAANGLVTFTVSPDRDRWSAGAELDVAYEALARRVAALPGVEGVAMASEQPLAPTSAVSSAYRADAPPPDPGTEPFTQIRMVGADYFDVTGMSFRAGRPFLESDAAGAEPVVILSEGAARALFQGADPLGRAVSIGMERGATSTVVGVVANVGQDLSEQPGPPLLYRPLAQTGPLIERFGFLSRSFVVRTAVDPYSVASGITAATRRMDSRALVRELRSVSDRVASMRSRPRAILTLIAAFTAFAVVLSAVGVFGVVSYVARQRSRELGIRVALGANNAELRRLVLGEGMRIAGVGALAGLGLSLPSLRALRGFLYEVAVLDPGILAGASTLACVIALAATALPAWRAGRAQVRDVLLTE